MVNQLINDWWLQVDKLHNAGECWRILMLNQWLNDGEVLVNAGQSWFICSVHTKPQVILHSEITQYHQRQLLWTCCASNIHHPFIAADVNRTCSFTYNHRYARDVLDLPNISRRITPKPRMNRTHMSLSGSHHNTCNSIGERPAQRTPPPMLARWDETSSQVAHVSTMSLPRSFPIWATMIHRTSHHFLNNHRPTKILPYMVSISNHQPLVTMVHHDPP